MTNEAIYNIRQYYFNEGKYLGFIENCRLLKSYQNYKMFNSNMAQQLLKEVDSNFKSFFSLLKLAKQGEYSFKDCNLPHYLPKDGYTTLIIGDIRPRKNKLILPFSRPFEKKHKRIEFTIPPILLNKKIKQIRIVPKANARFFEIHYIYEADCIQRELNIQQALAIDFGVDNLITAVSNTGKSFIIDGRKLKSINQWYNKENARLQSIKDKQHLDKKQTNKQIIITNNRNNKINDYISKTARKVIDYCIDNNIGTLIVGYNKDFQRNSKLGKQNNQIFVYIPYGSLRNKLKHLCELNSICYIEQEESYTSKASFWDKDFIPVYGDTGAHIFSGNRIYRGLYKTATGKTVNADINGALNIMRKSSVVDLNILYSRGDVDTPIRIRIT